ncbi:PH domain-containing protein [Bradymonadaceae bacterium TMQ3]|uniref:PH domain-containing protein n=1 Tax=Lujinxingia sediminis TaxID=2480984 RepID=A0ABY0CRL9_9DELT|nr:PH domain-containing protein [Lujinxingia sediminis]RDV37812.1 PH domain-containing protein [Bradymonadaceae bacterium TMQ3]RVU43215.1 PH domain-containing protein [Lujinxingia sediminis]TXC75404.1 PH domain-containing protein [Bradymonadales bacterium TMQ1]
MASPRVIRPNARPFLLRPTLWAAAFSSGAALVAMVAHAAMFEASALLLGWALLFPIITILVYVERQAALKKTYAEIFDDRIICHYGSLLSENALDLPFRNVTQIELTLPWLEHRIYQTGHLKVHAAGSATGAPLISVDAPEALYQLLEERLRHNGFVITRQNLVQREEPHFLGTLMDAGSSNNPVIGIPLLLLIALGPQLLDNPSLLESALVMGAGVALLLTFVAGALAFQIIRIIDLNQRVYSLYDDVVDYEDGFLTRSRRIIPIENLADTSIHQPFLKNLLGMADVIISCQGSSADIHFPSMPNAKTFRENLGHLIKTTDGPASHHGEERDAAGFAQANGDSQVSPFAPSPARSDVDVATASPAMAASAPPTAAPPASWIPAGLPAMSLKPGIVSVFLSNLIVAPFVVVGAGALFLVSIAGESELPALGGLVAVIALVGIVFGSLGKAIQEYLLVDAQITDQKVALTRGIFNKETTEFTLEKITRLSISQSPIDRWLNTATFRFSSIGASSALKLSHIPDADRVIPRIEKGLGFGGTSPHQTLSAEPTTTTLLYSQLSLLVICAIALIATMVAVIFFKPALLIGAALLLLAFGFFAHEALYAPTRRLEIFDHHLATRGGVLIHTRELMALHHAKDLRTTRYPDLDTGTLTISGGGASSSLSIGHLPGLSALHEHLDDLLFTHPPRQTRQAPRRRAEITHEFTPVIRAAAIQASAATAAAVVTIPLLPLFFAYFRLSAAHTTYTLELDRVRVDQGIWFKTRATVLLNRIDQVQTSRGPLDTALQVGHVQISTVGSASPEISMGPVTDPRTIYEAIDTKSGYAPSQPSA